MEKLDDKWIINFEKTDSLYKDFYKEAINFISISIIYINYENNITHVKQEYFFLSSPNLLAKEELIGIIQKNNYFNNKRFKLYSLLKYNFSLDTEDIKSFLLDKNEDDFLKKILINHNIEFSDTISMFHDINEVYIIFKENDTKSIHLTMKNSKKKHKQTIKKPFKA